MGCLCFVSPKTNAIKNAPPEGEAFSCWFWYFIV